MSKIADRIKTYKVANDITSHVEKYKTLYSCIATGVVVAGFTVLIMRDKSQLGSVAIGDATNGSNLVVVGEKAVLKNVSFISSNRQGSLSWVVRCLETGEIFTSQHKAAMAMELPTSELSRHLNGALDHVRDYHFERICISA
jgi:hypothetical protein